MAENKELPDAEVDVLIDAVLTASGSGMRHFTVQRTIERMRAAMREAVAKALATQAADAVPVALDSIEQYRMQMAAISGASLGYWVESDDIHPDYDTVPLRDVAKLYAKYDALYKAAHQSPTTAPTSEDGVSEESVQRVLKYALGRISEVDGEKQFRDLFDSAFLSANGFHTKAELNSEWAYPALSGVMFRSGIAAAQVAASKPAEAPATPEVDRIDLIHERLEARRKPAAASGEAVPDFIYTGQTGAGLEEEFEGITYGTAYFATPPAQAPALPATGEALTDAEFYRWWKSNRPVALLTSYYGNGCINKTVEGMEADIIAALKGA